MERKNVKYPFLGKVIVTLLDMDKLFVYTFFEVELSISSKMVSGMKKGENMCVSYYLQVINLALEIIGLKIFLPELYERIRQVLIEHKDLVIATVPHKKQGMCKPDEWVTIIKWKE